MNRSSARPYRMATVVLALALALAAGCARTAPAPARAQALIEAGNDLYRAGDFAGAARRYGAAVAASPDDPAAHFGLGMALARLGRDEDARAEYARARDLAERARTAAADSAS